MSRIVAIIGRPNVGKSTLFNRIVGSREAIVDDMPGVTRDRLYASTEWAGKTFTLIDTGGYVTDSTDVFEQAIREQAEIAISEAAVVIFVVDATLGIMPLDKDISDILRKSNKKIFLVVNKVDNDKKEPDAAPFYQLGLGEPITVSALVGRKIGDFLDIITGSFTTENDIDENDKRLKLAVVGKPNVGKSSFVNALLGVPRNIVTDIPGTTRDSIDSILKYQKEEIILIDTAGLRRKSRLKESVEFYSTLRSLKSIDRCDLAVCMVDSKAGIDKQDLRIIETIIERHRGVVLAANKWDAVEKDDQTAKAYEKALQNLLRMYAYIPIVFVSALERQRIYKVIDIAKKVYDEQTKRIPTNKLNTVLSKAVRQHPPSSSTGKEIKLNYFTQVKTNPPAFAFFANEPKLIADNYKRFLENIVRENFGFVGVPISIYFRKKN
jgi:GTP-binding protein